MKKLALIYKTPFGYITGYIQVNQKIVPIYDHVWMNCPKCGASGCSTCNGRGTLFMPCIYEIPNECPVCGMGRAGINRFAETTYICETKLGSAWRTQGIIDCWSGDCMNVARRYVQYEDALSHVMQNLEACAKNKIDIEKIKIAYGIIQPEK